MSFFTILSKSELEMSFFINNYYLELFTIDFSKITYLHDTLLNTPPHTSLDTPPYRLEKRKNCLEVYIGEVLFASVQLIEQLCDIEGFHVSYEYTISSGKTLQFHECIPSFIGNKIKSIYEQMASLFIIFENNEGYIIHLSDSPIIDSYSEYEPCNSLELNYSINSCIGNTIVHVSLDIDKYEIKLNIVYEYDNSKQYLVYVTWNICPELSNICNIELNPIQYMKV